MRRAKETDPSTELIRAGLLHRVFDPRAKDANEETKSGHDENVISQEVGPPFHLVKMPVLWHVFCVTDMKRNLGERS
jgi:hypothetical protein